MLLITRLPSDSFKLLSADIKFYYSTAFPNNEGLCEIICGSY